MPSLEASLWWDREIDRSGRVIRPDVRQAALSVWTSSCNRNQFIISDPSQAAELMELTVAQISRYLNRKDVEIFSREIEGLVANSFHRAVRRELVKRKRFLPLDESVRPNGSDADENWRVQIQARLELQEIVTLLTENSRRVLALRYAGYVWSEVAVLMRQPMNPLRAAFWRDIARVKRQVQNGRSQSNGLNRRY